jgi:hypothetical protein
MILSVIGFLAIPTSSTFTQVMGTSDPVLSFQSVAALRAYNTSAFATTIPQAMTCGYWAAGDGGANQFYWAGSSTDPDNDGTIIKPDTIPAGLPGRWRATATTVFNVKTFGAKFDGVTDDTVAIRATVATAGAGGGGTVLLPAGTTVLSDSVEVVGKHVSINGAGRNFTKILISNSPNSFPVRDGVFKFLSTTDGNEIAHLATGQYEVRDITIRFTQPETGSWQAYPYALHFDHVGLVAIERVSIELAWNAVNITNYAGGEIHDLRYSAFNIGLNVDTTANALAVDGLKAHPIGTTTHGQNGAYAYNANYKAVVLGQADGFAMSNSEIYGGQFIRNKVPQAQSSVMISNTFFDQSHGIQINTGRTYFDNCVFLNFDKGDGATMFSIWGGARVFISNSLLAWGNSIYPYAQIGFDDKPESGASIFQVRGGSIRSDNPTHDAPMFRMVGATAVGATGNAIGSISFDGPVISRADPDLGGANYGQPMFYMDAGPASYTLDLRARVIPMGTHAGPFLQVISGGPNKIDVDLPAGWW